MILRRAYRVNAPTVDEINFQLAQIADRMDQMEGFRGTPKFEANIDFNTLKGINVDSGTEDTDLPNVGQVDLNVALAVTQAKNDILPVGAIYLTIVSTNPGTLLDFGTWAIVGTGKLHIGTGTGGAGMVGSYDTDIENVLDPRTLIYIWQRTA
jgi:hypothetical protein